MDTEKALARVEELLKPFSKEITKPAANRLDVIVAPEKLIEAVTVLTKEKWGYLLTITGLDVPAPAPAPESNEKPGENHVELLYHFGEGAAIATLRVSLLYSNLNVPSVCGVIPAATLYEREIMEMLGVVCVGTPDPEKLLLPDDWPAGVFPLRKEFTGFNKKPDEGEGV